MEREEKIYGINPRWTNPDENWISNERANWRNNEQIYRMSERAMSTSIIGFLRLFICMEMGRDVCPDAMFFYPGFLCERFYPERFHLQNEDTIY